MLRVLAFFLLALLGPGAESAMTAAGPAFAPILGGARMNYDATSAAFTGTRTMGTPTTSGITVTDSNLAFLGPVGLVTGAAAARTYTVPAIARALMSACTVNPTLCLVAGGVAAGTYLDHTMRVRKDTQAGKAAGTGFYRDEGQNSVVQETTVRLWNGRTSSGTTAQCHINQTNGCYSTPGGACSSYSGTYFGYDPRTYSLSAGWSGGTSASCDYTSPYGNGYSAITVDAVDVVQSTTSCPAYVDPLVGPVAAGAPPFADGKCGTGIYASKTVDQVAALAATAATLHTTGDLTNMANAFDDWLHNGDAPCASCTAPAATLTGLPTTITGPTTTTTTTDPTGTTVSEETPTYAPAYSPFTSTTCQTLSTQCGSGGIVTWPKTTTKTDTFTPTGGGTPVVTTTVTTEPGAEAQPPEAVTQCDKFPESLGCVVLVPGGLEVTPVPNTTVSVAEIAPSDSMAPAGNACPAPRTTSVMGTTLSFSWEPMCTFADGIKPVVVGLAWVSAIFGFIGLSRKGD